MFLMDSQKPQGPTPVRPYVQRPPVSPPQSCRPAAHPARCSSPWWTGPALAWLWKMGMGQNPGTVPWTPKNSWVKMDVNNPLKICIYRYWPIPKWPFFWERFLEGWYTIQGLRSVLEGLCKGICPPTSGCLKVPTIWLWLLHSHG